MIYWAKYGVAYDVYFPMVKRAVVDLAVSADWTPATGDTKISKDGGSDANTSNNPAAVGSATAKWKLTLTSTEMQAKNIFLTIIDSATKVVEDQALVILTYGHPSAAFPFDFNLPSPCVEGVVTTGATTTSIPTSSLDPAASATDQFKGRIVVFDRDTTTANLRGQATDITASTSGGVLTVTALSHSPVNGDKFKIY